MAEDHPEHIKLVLHDTRIAIVQFNRPSKRNAFNQAMIDSIVATLTRLDRDDTIQVVVLTGSPEGPFCAGMDLNELVAISTADAHSRAFLKDLTDGLAQFSKPLIAAVLGYALGGGCEIALACDIIYAAEDSIFGLPEIKIGTIPGAGGTQRLARALGKHRAMEFILTGDSATGKEFHAMGVVNKIFLKQDVLPAAVALAERIAVMSGPIVKAAKQAVLSAETSHLDTGMTKEKALYYSTFDRNDCKEGLTAFLEKRKPEFTNS